MDKKSDDLKKKEDIVINVEPNMATAVIGMLRGYSRSIFDYIQDSTRPHGMVMAESFYDNIQTVLDEIYEKCIAKTDIREQAASWLDTLKEKATQFPGPKEGREEELEIELSIESLKQFEKHNPKIFQSNGKVRFEAYVVWKEQGDKPRTDKDIYVGWDTNLDIPTRGKISMERPDGKGGWETVEQFFPGMYYHFSYDQKTNELVVTDFESSLEIRIGTDLSVDDLIALRKNVN